MVMPPKGLSPNSFRPAPEADLTLKAWHGSTNLSERRTHEARVFRQQWRPQSDEIESQANKPDAKGGEHPCRDAAIRAVQTVTPKMASIRAAIAIAPVVDSKCLDEFHLIYSKTTADFPPHLFDSAL